MQAASWLADRGVGKVRETIELAGEETRRRAEVCHSMGRSSRRDVSP